MANRTYRYFTGEPLFAFGHGLSYTAFAYGPLNLVADSIDCPDTVRLSLPVKNTGSREGDEVVQVYVRQIGCAECQDRQPVRKLVGFKRVRVGVGESVVFEFTIPAKELRQWDSRKAAYTIAPGQYEIECGASSSDIRVRQSFTHPTTRPQMTQGQT